MMILQFGQMGLDGARWGQMELDHPHKYVCEYKRNNQKEFDKVTVSTSEFVECLTKSMFDELTSKENKNKNYFSSK